MFDKLIDLLIESLKIFRFCTVVNSYQKGVLLRFGKFKRVLNPGLVFFVPFWIDNPLIENVIFETMNVGPQSLTTKDGKSIVISTIVGFEVEDIQTFLLSVEGRNNVIEDATYGATAHFIMNKTWSELQYIDIGNELAKSVRKQAKKFGVKIVTVQLSDFAMCKSFRLVGQVVGKQGC